MELKMIGRLDDMPLFEVEKGRYIVIDVNRGRYQTMWTWYGYLGKFFDEFEKCTECPEERDCLKIIELHLSDIVNEFNRRELDFEDEETAAYFNDQEKFYDWIEPNRKFDYYSGKYEDE